MTVTVLGNPIGKPRMTKRDKWKQRPCVMAYRAWADQARYRAYGKNTTVKAYFESGKVHRVGPHTVKADLDNVCKAVMDALFVNDQYVYRIQAEKLWCDAGKPRVEVEWVS
jgi:Holliday junction resolvase RusA-like endonuclease